MTQQDRPPGTGKRNRGIPPLAWVVIAILLGWIAIISFNTWT
jgi:hypothetical protein